MADGLQVGSRALVYYVQAAAWDRLSSFASFVVTSMIDPRLLEALIPHLQTAAESAPEGPERWSCLCSLADALARSGRPQSSLLFYDLAITMARAATEARGKQSRRAWSDLAWITGNSANALNMIGKPDAPRQRHMEAGAGL
jgi:hypothetical protein